MNYNENIYNFMAENMQIVCYADVNILLISVHQ